MVGIHFICSRYDAIAAHYLCHHHSFTHFFIDCCLYTTVASDGLDDWVQQHDILLAAFDQLQLSQ
jgi:hypothetical protein